MDLLKKTVEQVTKETILLLLCLSAFLCLFPRRQSLVTGLAFGAVVALLNFRLLRLTVIRFTQMESPQQFLKRQHFKRLLIYAAAFSVAVRKQSLNDAAVVLGFFLPKIAIYFDVWRHKNVLALRERTAKE